MTIPHLFLNASGRLRSGWWIAIFMAVLTAFLFPVILLGQRSEGGVPVWLQALVVLFASVLCQTLRRKPMSDLFGAFDARWLGQLAIGGALGAAVMAVPALIMTAFGLVAWRLSPDGFSALGPALLLFLAVAVTEELMFRGFVFQRFIDGLGAWPAQLIVAAFFVLTHSAALQDAGALAPMAGVNIFIASIMFGLAYLRTRSLAMPIGIHLMANFVQGGVLGFGVSGNEEPGLLAPTLTGPDWLTGGAFGIEASVPGLVCLLVLTFALLRWRGVQSART
jgi:membrane protease YdiL (CAAX protease family)